MSEIMDCVNVNCQFVNEKIRKIKWQRLLTDKLSVPDKFVTGSWDSFKNVVTLWHNSPAYSDDSSDILRERFNPIAKFQITGDVADMSFLNEDQILCSTSKGDLLLLQYHSSEETLNVEAQWSSLHKIGTRPCSCTCFSIFGSDVVTGGEDGQLNNVKLDRPDVNNTLLSKHSLSPAVYCIQHHARSQIVTGTAACQLQLWDIRSDIHQASLSSSLPISSSSSNAITSLACHPAEQHLVCFGTQKGEVAFCDLRKTTAIPTLLAVHSGPVWQVAFHPIYPDNCFSCSDDGTLLHWDAAHLKQTVLGSLSEAQLNPWLMGETLTDKLNLTNLVSEQILSVNCLDVCSDNILCATDNQSIYLISNLMLR